MVSNLDMQRLNGAISEQISNAVQATGYAVHAEIKTAVVLAHADIIARVSAEMADAHVGKMVTSHLRTWTKIRVNGARQLSLPGVPATILEHMPVLITVPADDADLSDEDVAARPETKHVALDRASVGQLRRYWRFIEAHLKSVEKRFDATGFIVRRCEGCLDDVSVVDALMSKSAGKAA